MSSLAITFRRLPFVCLAGCWLVSGVAPSYAGKVISTHAGTGAAAGHVAVVGSVTRPAAYELPGGTVNLTDIVQLAGGLTPEASGNVRVIRKGGGGFQTFYSNQTRFPLWDGDVVVIDQRLRGQALPRRGASPMISVALVNLVARPVVVDLPPEYASLRGALHLLRNPLTNGASLQVMQPGRAPQRLSVPMAPVPVALTSGTVIVFDPTTIIARNLPPLPPALRPQDILAAQGAGLLPRQSHPQGPDASQAADPPSRIDSEANFGQRPVSRSRVDVWNGSSAERAQALPNQNPALNSRPIPTIPASNSTPGSNPASPPLLNIQNPAAASTTSLPDPSQPFSSPGSNPSLVVTASTASPTVNDSLAAPSAMDIRSTDSPAALVAPGSEPVAIDETEAAPPKTSVKNPGYRKFVLPIMAGLCLTAGFGMWLKYRFGSAPGIHDEAAGSAAITIPEARTPANSPAIAATIPLTAAKPTASVETSPVANPGHSLRAPHSAAAATIAARRSSTPGPYDVVMPPESVGTVHASARPSSGTSVRTDTAGQSGLLDRVLATVHGSRRS